MKAVLMSIHPKWCEKIFNGEKTIEVRKTAPKLETPFTVYVYCTKGKMYLYRNPNNGELFLDSNGSYRGGDYEDRYLTGKVIGSFVCNWYDEFEKSEHGVRIKRFSSLGETRLSVNEMREYIGDRKKVYGWHITEPKLFDKPKELTFYKPCPKKWKNCPVCEFYSSYTGCCANRLTRAPQSWSYVEEQE